MKVYSILIVLVFAVIIGCDDLGFRHKDKLPKFSSKGAGTFGCYANGRLFVNKGEAGYGVGLNAEVQQIGDTTGVIIYAFNSKDYQSLIMSMYDIGYVKVNKPYSFSTRRFDLLYSDGGTPGPCDYRESISGTIIFSRYEVSGTTKVVSGGFSATAFSSRCGGQVELTQGRFDISDITHQ